MVQATHATLEDLLQTDLDHLLHPLHNRADHLDMGPVILVQGEGVYVQDASGRRFIDALSGLWNVNVGHGRAELAAAAADQMRQLAYGSGYTGFASVPAIELAEKLATLAPKPLKATFFTSGGAESNETAFKLARFYWQLQGRRTKTKIISRREAYHGVTGSAMMATGIPGWWQFEPLTPGFSHIASQNCYHCEFGKSYPNCSIDCAEALEAAILAEGPENVAAFIGEPVKGAGGVLPPPPEYWPRIRQICDKYDVLLIADEVITGFGRTGRWFAMPHWDVVPDLMSFAKGVTSAYAPLGGVMVSERIHQAMVETDQRFMHAYTYSGHPMCCAVGLKNVEIIEREGLVERAAQTGQYLQNRIHELADRPGVGNVRGFGLMAAVEVVADRATKTPYPREQRVGERIVKAAMQRGVIFRSRGDAICMAPPLIITTAQIDTMLKALDEAIVEAAR